MEAGFADENFCLRNRIHDPICFLRPRPPMDGAFLF